jgi:hypothetical protein
MGGISYKRTLELVEEFMVGSNIRKYCSEVCKGKCCESCYKKNPYACHHCEGRRLPCSIYLCNEKFLRWVSKEIKEQYRIYNSLKCTYANIYFTNPDEIFLEIVRFPSTIENIMEDLDIVGIRKTINELIKTKRKIR